jgi:hypothetical protein
MCLEKKKKHEKSKLLRKTTRLYTEYSPKVVGISNRKWSTVAVNHESQLKVMHFISLPIIAEE